MDKTYDVIVAGSGSAGLAAGLRARDLGLSVLVLEKEHQWGGTSASSGGGVWVPNHGLAQDGDSREKALTYLQAVSQGPVRQANLEALVDGGPQMVKFLDRMGVPLHVLPGYPDYFPEAPGAHAGRALFPYEVDSEDVGEAAHTMREAPVRGKLFNRYAFGLDEAFALATRGRGWQLIVARMFWRYWSDLGWRRKTSRDRRLTMGNGLMGGLRRAFDKAGGELWTEAAVVGLTTENGRVTGVEVNRHGRRFTLAAKHGVVIAAGGFEWNQTMRDKYFTLPTPAQWSTSPERANDGKAMIAAQAIGADVEFMETGWYIPSMLMPTIGVPNTEMTHQMSFDHGRPHSVCVNGKGARFVKETIAYDRFGLAMIADHQKSGACSTAWLVFDDQFREKYSAGGFMLKALLPDSKVPRHWWDHYIYRADSIEQLAAKIAIDAQALAATVGRMNDYARSGTDPEFGRGSDEYDRFFGDPRVQPNTCLGTIEKGPFYAVPVVLGDMGTKGGLKIDENARVIDTTGAPIAGLYAAGNAAGSITGNCYPGAGGTIGPAMTFGFIAANTIAQGAGRNSAPERQ